MHLHAFYCSFSIIIVGLILVVYTLTLYRWSHLSTGGRFTVIECFHHATWIWICLRKQKVVLDDVFAISVWNSGSVVRYVLHETGVSFIHVTWWALCFVWIVESWSCCVRPIASKVYCIIQISIVIYAYIVLETLIKALVLVYSSDWSSSIREFVSVIFTPLSFVERISMTVSSRLSSSTYRSVVSRSCWTFILLMNIESHSCHIHHVGVVPSMLLSISWIIQGYVVVIKLHWVTGTSSLSLFSKFGLSNCFIYIWSIWISVPLISHNSRAVLSWIEELCCHHHLLVGIWCFPLICKIEINICDTRIGDRSSDSAAVSEFLTISIRLHDLSHIVLLSWVLLLLLSGIASFHLTHEVSIDLSISHVSILIILRKFTSMTWCWIKSSSFSLIESTWFSTLYVWKHIVDSRIIRRLQHDTIVSCIHFIDAERTILSICTSTLFSNSVCHKESLICARPKKEN